MSSEVFNVISRIENELTSLDFARRMLEETSHDLSTVISLDRSKEDEERKRNLLNRREALGDFIDIAIDYVAHAQEALREVVNEYSM